MKKCKQCQRLLGIDNFRPTKSRSTGIRKSTTGTRTMCRECESLNVQAHSIVKLIDAGAQYNVDKLRKLKEAYQVFVDAGYPLVSAAAQRLMYGGISKVAESTDIRIAVPKRDDLTDLYEHITKLKERSYSSCDEADEVHKALVGRLHKAGLYEEATELLDEWWFDE